MKKQFSEEQIIKILKEHEDGKRPADTVREHGISEQTFYHWKSKFGGMDVSEAKRLKQLEKENRRLKEMSALISVGSETCLKRKKSWRLAAGVQPYQDTHVAI